jgi:bifunctional DNA-binding transcriptional regulator/antitoxin component of YhaV-PrlF toxin-antitoxin module
MTGPSVPPEAADRIIAALALPRTVSPGTQRARPLPLAALPALPRDGSVLYCIAKVDVSGRVTNREIAAALGWKAGDPLEVTASARAIIIRASDHGMASVPHKPGLIIPAAARHRCGIQTGDSVLLAAAPGYGLVLVHTMTALDGMLASYHSAAPASETT